MARPARVRIRRRKPCTRARRRLFGWKVRLPLATAVSPQLSDARTRHRHEPVMPEGTSSLVSSRILLASRRGTSLTSTGRSRIATCGRLFEGTDLKSQGQTSLPHVRNRYRFVARSEADRGLSGSEKRSGSHTSSSQLSHSQRGKPTRPRTSEQCCRTVGGRQENLLASANAVARRRQTTEPERSRRYEPTDVPVTSLSARASCMQNTSTTALSYFVHSLWITMWTDCRRFIEPPVRRLRGGSRR